MLYILAVVLGILIGTAFNGRISNLNHAGFRKLGLLLIAFVIQLAAQAASAKGFTPVIKNSIYVYALTYSMLCVWFWLNRRYAGVLIVGFGCICNAFVMIINGGKMPVGYDAAVNAGIGAGMEALKNGLDGKHILIHEGTRMTFLADIINPPSILGWGAKVISLGDILVILGVLILVIEVIQGKKQMKEKISESD